MEEKAGVALNVHVKLTKSFYQLKLDTSNSSPQCFFRRILLDFLQCYLYVLMLNKYHYYAESMKLSLK